MARLAVES
uniref:Uncharacterized protein n=1 Tax=Arundo donax TaxID=35708 RepID=A0A0A9F9C4_ARUDO